MPVRESVCILQWKMDTDDWMRFLNFVEITETCWVWTGFRNQGGYGTFQLNGKAHSAHRIALSESLSRPLLPGMCAAHTPEICHNRACVNPEHLREATKKENAADRKLDGTEADRKGSKNGNAKLSEADVLRIRDDPRLLREIAADFGISQRLVSYVKRREVWVHII